jgi:hypothetical protein
MAAPQREADVAAGNRWGPLRALLVMAVVVYLLPLIALGIDEIVLETYWIAKQFPRGARAVFFDVYPFLKFME